MFGENVIPIAERFHYIFSTPYMDAAQRRYFLNFSGVQKSISTAYVACVAGAKTLFLLGS
jgi:hypothetical protein